MFIVQHRKIFFAFSALIIGASFAFMVAFGLKPSIDFTGGSVLEVSYTENRPSQTEVSAILAPLGLGNVVVRHTGDQGVLIKMATIDNDTKEVIKTALSNNGTISLTEEKFNTVGPTLGKELLIKSVLAVVMILVAITLYLAYVFRHVSKPVSSWKYGFTTIIALAHDIVVMVGTFALLGFLVGTEVDTLFITAILVILGYSVNDSVVVLDRVRENLARLPEEEREEKFNETVGKSLTETMGRSINTSLTTLLGLVALAIFGADATRDFAIALIVGVIIGAYSSIFIGATLLVSFFEKQKRDALKNPKSADDVVSA
jgi:preprotein translocase subunit SecF